MAASSKIRKFDQTQGKGFYDQLVRTSIVSKGIHVRYLLFLHFILPLSFLKKEKVDGRWTVTREINRRNPVGFISTCTKWAHTRTSFGEDSSISTITNIIQFKLYSNSILD